MKMPHKMVCGIRLLKSSVQFYSLHTQWASSCINYCIKAACSCNGGPDYFDGCLLDICLTGSGISHLPPNNPRIMYVCTSQSLHACNSLVESRDWDKIGAQPFNWTESILLAIDIQNLNRKASKMYVIHLFKIISLIGKAFGQIKQIMQKYFLRLLVFYFNT